MPDKKISEITENASPAQSDFLVEVDGGGASKKISITNLAKALGYWFSSSSVADDGTVALPTITANASAHGFIQVSSSGVINESAEFEIDSTGTAALIRGTANVVVNADTDVKVCIGTAAAQNPLTIKNRLGGTRTVMITIWYN